MSLVGFINGKIYVSFKPLRIHSGLLVANGRVVYVGDSDVVSENTRRLGGRLVDLGGKTVIPGFIDSHVHLDALGMSLSTLDLRGVKSIEEIKRRLREYVSSIDLEFVVGHGWDHESLSEKRWPTRWDLDEVVWDKPVLLTRTCLHVGVVNTKALSLLKTLDVKGIDRDSEGIPTGILFEDALKAVRDEIRERLNIGDYVKFLEKAQEYLLSMGVTTVGFLNCSLKCLKALFILRDSGLLKLRTRVYLNPYEKTTSIVEILRSLGFTRGFGDEHLKIMGVKLFIDGALGPRTAWLTQPYSDDPSTSGYPISDLSDIRRIARLIDETGLQLAIHAIGDRAVEEAIDIYRELENTKRLRHRIEHVSVLRDDLLRELRETGAVAVVQPHFVISDWWAKSRLGNRVVWLYRFKSMIENNIPLALSTDTPVEPADPWLTIYAAITRGKYEKIPYYEDTYSESLDIDEALHAYTHGSAYSLHEEENTGSLEPGKYADFIVLNRDPYSTEISELKTIKVTATYIGGVRVY